MLQHVGLHRLAVGGGLLQGGHVPDAGQGHVQRPGDGGGGQGEHVHLFRQLLEPLLVGDAEALLLVHHQQAQVLEPNVLLQQPVPMSTSTEPFSNPISVFLIWAGVRKRLTMSISTGYLAKRPLAVR